MRPEVLDMLQCPYCGGGLQPKATYADKAGETVSGLVACACSTFPIVEGILVLRPQVDRSYLANLVERGRIEKATSLLMTRPDPQPLRFVVAAGRGSLGRRALLAPLAAYLMAEGRRRHSYVVRDLPFFRVLGDSPFEAYLKHRFSAETMWMVYAIVPLLSRKRGVVLDLGCGAGHASHVLSSLCRPRELICADLSFWELYLARKHMAPNASFVQLDANFPLPIRDNSVDAILSVDMLHYLEVKRNLVEQSRRVLQPEGALMFLHLHNAGKENPSPGIPLAAAGWVDLFRGIPLRAISDRRILEDLTMHDRLDLRQSSPGEELEAASAISIIASHNASHFALYERVREQQFEASRNLRLNPIYRRGGTRGEAVRILPSVSFSREFPLVTSLMPERVSLSCSLERPPSEMSPEEKKVALEMFRRFVLVDLPNGYV